MTTLSKCRQAGFNLEEKSVRVAHYAKNMMKEVGITDHACGVKEPRGFRRRHARIVTELGKSISFSELYHDDEEAV